MENIFDLIERKNSLSHQLLGFLKNLGNFMKNPDERASLLYKMNQTKKSLKDITAEIIKAYAPNLTNGEIDLVKSEFGNLYYKIFLHGTQLEIGYIEYRGYHYDINLGDIGYKIIENYRGHNYAFKAVCLLNSLLMENGIDDFWITSKNDNIASLKIVEKLGGVCLEESDGICKFVCATSNIAKKVLG